MAPPLHVVWLSYGEPDVPARGYWDQGIVEALLANGLWRTGRAFEHHVGLGDVPAGAGAVVVLPAAYHAGEVPKLNRDLGRLRWALVILTGDECSLFPWRRLRHSRLKLWIQTPRPDRHRGSGGRYLGVGFPPDTQADLALHKIPQREKPLAWFFAGQVTHSRREECVAALRRCGPGGMLAPTEGFLQGMPRPEYLHLLASAKIAPCPAGPATPDSFRLWEALEAGCVPIADDETPEGWHGYWSMAYARAPFPIVRDWSVLPDLIPELLADWPAHAVSTQSRWLLEKRAIAQSFRQDLQQLTPEARPEVADRVTVLMPTSLIAEHPDTTTIETTIASVRAQPDLAEAEILLMADGLRDDQQDARPRYEEYLRRLLFLANHRWRNVAVVTFDGHQHQANMTRATLELVRSPCVVFVEHDTPIVGPVPWGAFCDAVQGGLVNVIRLSHEASILDAHRHLMLDESPVDFRGVPLVRTMQWSQRPHLALTDWYRSVIARYFGRASRTMIEDVMHGVCDQAWRELRQGGWRQWRLAIYAPPGDIKRSGHLDGRAGADPFPCVFAYDGPVPRGAPFPTALRTE